MEYSGKELMSHFVLPSIPCMIELSFKYYLALSIEYSKQYYSVRIESMVLVVIYIFLKHC